MKVLAISVHPDDETLGCGGTLLKHAANGDELHWLLITRMDLHDFSPEQIRTQASQVHRVEKAYPFRSLTWLEFPTTRLDTIPYNALIDSIRKPIEIIRPDSVYIPNRSDVHSDHRITFQCAISVLKSFYLTSLGVRRVLACEVLSETNATPPFPEMAFIPNIFVDISTTIERKLEIMQLYETEVQADPSPRSLAAIQSLAKYRGSTVSLPSAESFMLIQEICL